MHAEPLGLRGAQVGNLCSRSLQSCNGTALPLALPLPLPLPLPLRIYEYLQQPADK